MLLPSTAASSASVPVSAPCVQALGEPLPWRVVNGVSGYAVATLKGFSVVSPGRPRRFRSCRPGMKGKKAPPDQTPNVVDRALAELDQAVEALAVDQRVEAAADVDVGRRLAGRLVADDADRVVGAGGHRVVDLGDEGEALLAAGARRR